MASEKPDESKENVLGKLNGETSPDQEEDLQAAEVSSLNFVLRASQWKAKLAEYVRATPWWTISIALHVAAALILGKMVMLTKPKPEEDLIITTEIKTEDLKPLDLKKIEQVFKEMNVVQTEPVVHAPTLITQTTVEVVETTTIEQSDLVPSLNDATTTDESFTGVGTGAGDAEGDAVGDGFGAGDLDATDVIGIGETGFTSRGGSYKGIMSDLTVRVARGAKGKKYKGNVLLIWLMDASLSMKDDQQAIKERLWEMDRKFREQEGAGDLMQAVIYYSDKPHLWLKPTADVDQVMKSIDAIELSPPGTVENTMAALIFAANTFAQSTQKAKKVLVHVDDDSPDDSDLLEKTLAELRKAQMTLFVINRECPFQSEYLLEPFKWVDRDGDEYSGSGTVHRGPETAYPEVTQIAWGQFFTHWWGGMSAAGAILSGFGIYDISRLAFHTGGAYYILDPMPEAEKQAMYDWDLMEVYRPELVSREEYQKRTARNHYKATLESVTKSWNNGAPIWHWVRWPDLQGQMDRCKKKLDHVDNLIQEMEQKALMPASQLEKLKENRRWPANADLVWASLILARHRVRQFKYGMEEFLRETNSIPEDHIVTFHAHQPVKATEEEAKDRAEIIKAVRYVADRHPRTPWGKVAAMFEPNSNQYLYGFKFFHQYYFPPYCALIEANNGQKYEAYISDEKANEITFTVSGKGTRTVNKKLVKKITKISCPGNINHHPRI